MYRYQVNALKAFKQIEKYELLDARTQAINHLWAQAFEEDPEAVVSEGNAFNLSANLNSVRFRHVLLPVWIVPSPEGKAPLMLDGCTGSLFNINIPIVYSRWKIRAAIAILILCAAISLPSLVLALLVHENFLILAAVPLMFVAVPLMILLGQAFSRCRSGKAAIDNDFVLW